MKVLFGAEFIALDKGEFPKAVEHPRSFLYRQMGFWNDEPKQVKIWVAVCVGIFFALAILVNFLTTIMPLLTNLAPPAALGGSVFIP